MEIIKIERLRYRYPGAQSDALGSIDLSMKQGDFLLVTGPSGSGKSTLLGIMAGLIPDFYGGMLEGTVYIKGDPMFGRSKKEIREDIGMVFQNPEAQIIMKSVVSDIALGPENLGLSTSKIGPRIERTAKLLDLESMLERDTQELSSGEKQRVAIASILAMDPRILILDEPTSQLDLESSERIFETLKTLKKQGYTIILSEQRLTRFLPLTDRVITMDNGRIAEDSDPVSYMKGSKDKFSYDNRKIKKDPAVMVGDAILDIKDLSFKYNGMPPILSGLDLKVRKGELISVLGKNGTGKSTLLKIIAGILKPLKGEMSIGNRPVENLDLKERARLAGFLSQNPNDYLFNDTVEKELEYTAVNLGVNDPSRIDKILSILGLEGLRHEYPRDLSTGQRQRVALGSVLAGDPSLMMLDEPTRGLDHDLKSKLGEFLLRLTEDNRCVILITQDIDFAFAFSDRTLLLKHGKLTETDKRSSIEQEFLRV